MKTVLKSLMVGIVVFAMAFSPAMMGVAMAGGIYFEGISSAKSIDDQRVRGLMFNFSFGGPEDYKNTSSIQEVYRSSLTTKQKTGLILGTVLLAAAVMMAVEEDDGCISFYDPEARPTLSLSADNGGGKEIPPGFCESGEIYYPEG